MTGKLLRIILATIGLALAACAASAPSAKEAFMPNVAAASSANMMPPEAWPLKFKSHRFGAHCYDTYACKVVYGGRVQRDDDPTELRPSSAGYGPDYQRNWSGIHAMIPNFPLPAVVSWRSKDGTTHEARIDIGELFKDEVIRHNVTREEMADLPGGEFENEPAILLEINDRTVRVYTRTHVPTKGLQKPGNRYSDFRNDLILVKTYEF